MLIPRILLAGGRVVRGTADGQLVPATTHDPIDLVRHLGRVGEVAVVDLDAVRGTGDNLALVEELCAVAPCRVGGGIRDLDRARQLLRSGACTLIIGTEAKPAFLAQLARSRVIVAVDARADRVVTNGWTENEGESPIDRAKRLAPYVSGFLYTVVERDGTGGGLDLERVRALAEAVDVRVTAAGGIASVKEVVTLDLMGVDAQVSTALYDGAVSPAECLAALVDFDRGNGGVPTVVQDARDLRVLLIAQSTRASLTQAVERGETVLYSRDQGLWRPGEDSGQPQQLVRVEVDCDRDALLFHVVPAGPSCDRGTESCFGKRPFTLAALEQIIDERAAVPDESSYTRRLTEDVIERRAKILEEAHQLVDARRPEEVRWEAADLLFHIVVDLKARGLGLADVLKELEARRK